MKKILFTALAAITMAGSAQAQYYSFDDMSDNGLSGMVYGGMTISNLNMGNLPMDALDPKTGFALGLRMEYLLPQCYGVFVNAGLEYTMKGARSRVEAIPGETGADWIARPMYVRLPIHVGYRYDMLEDFGIYADFGPYLAVGTNGKTRLKYDDFSDDDTWRFFRNGKNPTFYDIKRFDVGFGFRIGAEYAKHYNLLFSCDWGLTNMLTQDQKHTIAANPGFENPALKNFNAAITFGYRF